jgi:hypothetical protein
MNGDNKIDMSYVKSVTEIQGGIKLTESRTVACVRQHKSITHGLCS